MDNNIISLNQLYNSLRQENIDVINKIKSFYNKLLDIESTNNYISDDNINIDSIKILTDTINDNNKIKEILNEYIHLILKYTKIIVSDDNIIINNIKVIEYYSLLNFKNIFEILFNSNINRYELINILDDYNKINDNILITNNILSTENKKILIDLHELHKKRYLELCYIQESPIGCLIDKIDNSIKFSNKKVYDDCLYGCELCKTFNPFINYYKTFKKDHILSKIKLNIILLSGQNIMFDCNYHKIRFYDIYNELLKYFKDNKLENPMVWKLIKLVYKDNIIYTYPIFTNTESTNITGWITEQLSTFLCTKIHHLVNWEELVNNIIDIQIIYSDIINDDNDSERDYYEDF